MSTTISVNLLSFVFSHISTHFFTSTLRRGQVTFCDVDASLVEYKCSVHWLSISALYQYFLKLKMIMEWVW